MSYAVPPLVVPDGSVSAPSIRFRNNGSTGFFRTGSSVALAIKGVEVIRWASTGAAGVTGALTVTSAGASALAVGLNGATTPALNIDASTAVSVTGLNIKSAAAAGGLALAVISSVADTNDALTIDAKGNGTITFAGTSTGAVQAGNATNPALKVVGATSGTGISITSAAAAGGVAVAAISSGGAEGLTLDAKSTGVIGIAGTSTGAVKFGNQTNPAFQVVVATAGTGISVTSAAAAAGVALAAISSGGAENLTIDAKGTGTITFGSVSTGNIVFSRAATGLSLSVTGLLTAQSGTAVPATAGAIAAGAALALYSGGNKIWITSDAPTHSATKGDLCINTGGSSTSTRMYVNNGTTNWVAFTTAS